MPHDDSVLIAGSHRVRNLLIDYDRRIEILEQTFVGVNKPINLIVDLGAIGDGTLHPLSDRYATLAEAQQVYPLATSLTDSIDWAALQTGVENQSRIFIPVGDYILNKEVVVTGASQSLFLDGDNNGFTGQSHLIGDVSLGDKPMFRQDHGWVDIDNQLIDPDGNILPIPQPSPGSGTMIFNVSKVYFEHRGADHAGIMQFNLVSASSIIKECYIDHGSGRGIALGAGFGVKYDTVRFLPNWADEFVSDVEAFKRWAIIPSGHSTIVNCDFVRCGGCIALGGLGVNVLGGRFEVNVYGVSIGEFPSIEWENIGDPKQWKAGFLNGVTFEQNRYALDVGSAFGCEIKNLSIQGSETPGGVISKTGVQINANNSQVSMRNISVSGDVEGFQNYVFNTKTLAEFVNLEGATSITSVFNDTPSSTGYDFKGEHREGEFQVKSDFVMRGLTQLVLDRPTVLSRKLAGLETLPISATTQSVVFLPNVGTGTAAFSAAASVDPDVGSTLTPNDYDYSTTLLNRIGETGIDDTLTFETVTVVAQERVTLTFSPNTNSSMRRIYRRIVGETGWEAYFEFPATGTTFEDTGQTPDGVDSPPLEGNQIPSEIEDDANYEVILSPSWLTTWRITNKLTTGFDMEFGTATPTANETVSWLQFRP